MDERHATVDTSQRVYSGRIFNVQVDRVLLPNGHMSQLEVVRHNGSVVLVPLPAPGRILLVRQYRYAIDRWIWEVPAGSLKRGEDPAAGARRECQEETGLIPGRIEMIGRFYPTPGFCDEFMIFFKLTELAEPPADAPKVEMDEDEVLTVNAFTVEDAQKMVRKGDIVDMKTVLALTMV